MDLIKVPPRRGAFSHLVGMLAGWKNCKMKPGLTRSQGQAHRHSERARNPSSYSNPQRGNASEMEDKPSTEENKISQSRTPSYRNPDP